MNYVGNIIRPPSEANSMILQATVGCSHNKCGFCAAYKLRKFYIKDINDIKTDIDMFAAWKTPYDKAFIADGDALIMPTDMLLEIINYMKEKVPSLERIGVYANTKSILKKSVEELKELKAAGLGIVYQGIESGNEKILRKMKKGALPGRQLETALKIKESGILLSQTVLLGLGGIDMSNEHARDTGKHLGEMSPDFASALTVMIIPFTDLHKEFLSGAFRLPDKFGILSELRLMLENMNVQRPCYFTSNHASNYLPLKIYLPEQKNEALDLLEYVIRTKDSRLLRPESMRAL